MVINMQKKGQKKSFNVILVVIIILFLISTIIFIFKEIERFKTIKEIDNSKIPITETIISVEEEINNLKSTYNNSEIIGLVTIPNSELNTPIVQTDNNNFYLNHSLTKDYSIIGATFLDYRNNLSSRQLTIYGHNSGNYNPPFRVLQNYLDESFYKEHQIIELKVNNEKRTYEIFSVAIVEKSSKEEHMQFNYQTDNEWLDHFNKLKSKSLYESNLVLNETDNIIVLQTCVFGVNNGKLLIVVGKEIKV